MNKKNIRVGITCGTDKILNEKGIYVSSYLLKEYYVNAVKHAGGIPLIMPAIEDLNNTYFNMIDALLITGADMDIPPDFYNEKADTLCREYDRSRSLFEKNLLLEAIKRDMPVLGICGGMQLLNVVLGGTLYQDVSQRENTDNHEQPFSREKPYHDIIIEKSSLLYKIYGTQKLFVNSTHHQMIKECADDLLISSRTSDGVIESLEMKNKSFIIGVQWHPEALPKEPYHNIYRAFINAVNTD